MTDSLPILAAVLAACAAAIAIGIVLWRARHAADPHAAVLTELSRAHSDAGHGSKP
jgi:hypothetical protein